ncbi:MAG: acyl--CoA ligase [Proteobacteria bacterium]|nr:acyl--CoA ligase [Pseudomonadota bacterium]
MLLYSWLERAVKAKGTARALIYRDTYLSWRGLLHRVDRRASELAALGLRAGDLAGLMLGNVPDFVILSLALSKLDCAPLPLDPTTSTRELEMLQALVPLRGLITRPRGGDVALAAANAGTAAAARPARPKPTPESRKRLQGTLLSCSIYPTEPRAPARTADEQIAAVLVTADSAGDPKPVERTVANLRAEAAHLTAALGVTEDDRALLSVPLFSSFGFDIGMVACLQAGATLCLEDEVGPARIAKVLRDHSVTLLPGNQTLFSDLARLPATRPTNGKSAVRFLSLGGGLTGSTVEGFVQRYGARPLGCMHTAETGTVAIDGKGQAGESVGKVLKGVQVRVVDPTTGKAMAAGRQGALWVRGPAVSPLALAAPALPGDNVPVGTRDGDGWLRTGDLVAVDRSKRMTLFAREDDLVRIDGKRVALGEVEACIEALPVINQAQAQLIHDPLGGPMVVARVVLKDRSGPVEAETIIDHCARNLSPYKVPRRIEFCDVI